MSEDMTAAGSETNDETITTTATEAGVPTAQLERLMNIAEVAEYLRVPVKTIYNWRNLHKAPPAMMIGARLMWRPSDIAAWMESRVSA